MVKERNINLDIIRGIAAYSVVANHVLSHFAGYSESMLGNINFSLQNPLFMMVSGWALMYSKPIVDGKSFVAFLKKRTVLLILPWVIWSLLKWAMLSDKPFVAYFGNNLYHMEGLYWFLFSLWVMNVIYAIACLFFKKIVDKRVGYSISVSLASMVLVSLLFVVGYATVGVDFLGIKFTAYYFPFFLSGWFGSELTKRSWNEKKLTIFDWIVCANIIIYAILIANFNIASLPEKMAPLRFFISAIGCLVLFYIIFKTKFSQTNKMVQALAWGGQKTLELYVVHYIVMGFLKNSGASVLTVLGFSEFILDLVIVLTVTVLFICIIDSNKIAREVLFGKIKV